MKNAKWWMGLLAAGCVWMIAPASTAYGATAESEPFRLSLKADGVRESTGNETLAYSTLWAGSGAEATTLRQDGETLVERLEGEGDWAWSVERNGTYVLTHTIYEGGDAVGEETATFTVSGWEVPFPDGDVAVAAWEGKYDGTGHGVEVSVAEELEGVSVHYATSESGPWSLEPPLFTNACTSQTVWCEFSGRDYITQTNSATVTVLPREVTLTSADASKRYDGEALTAHGVTVGGDGFVEDEGAEYEWTGSQTDAGASANAFSYTLNEGTDAGNYAISTVFGTLTVEKASAGGEDGEEPGGGEVPEGGLSVFDTAAVYDGAGHTIDTNALVEAFAGAMIGDFTVEYAAAEEEPSEGWVADAPLFTNVCSATVCYRVSSPNYEDFVHAARVTITARPVEVRVSGATGTFGYDGEEKSVEGYVLETEDELFDVHGMTRFGGTAVAQRTDAGRTAMGLAAVEFSCTDANFAATYVVVEDGWVEVTAADISDGEEGSFVVTLGSNPMYGGTEKSVEVELATWKGLPMTFEVAGNTAVDAGSYRLTVTGTGNFAGTQTAEWAVLRRAVTLTSADSNKEYDGTALTAQEVTVGGDGWAEGEGAEYAWTGTQTDVGTSENTFTYTLLDGTKAGNYDITTAFGTLEVTKGTQSIVFPAIGTQSVTNTLQLGAMASSGLPVSYEVTSGPGLLEGDTLSFTWVGTVMVTATQAGDGNWNAAEPVSIEVEVTGLLTLTVECAHGTAEPSVGAHEILLGTPVETTASGSPEALGEGLRAVCTGWRLDGNAPDTGEGMVARFTLTNSATLTWLWETQALVEAEALAHGTTEGSGWYALGSQTALRAVPNAGHPFTGWMGDVPGGSSSANPLEMTVTGPGQVVATFFTTYYAREDGSDAASGLSWAAAKREIASALAETAWGDTVVAASGTYQPIAVPESVTVRSLSGPEETCIAGSAGTRCVEAAADALVEGFALEGGETDGDGGGALLATGAELHRCILRGNRADGTGGGAKGGELENCLLIGNTASSGGGASGAELRHCTVVRNAGGGATDCRTVNSIFWENDGGDVSGGTTMWSLCNPIVAGSGNIDGEPLFAGEDDWHLLYDSPCLDAATDSAVQEDLTGAPRPQPRVYGEALKPDMGCYEYVPKARFVWEKGSATPPYESWADAARDIQSALDISGSGDRIVVEAGTYAPVTVSNAVILMGYRGPERTVIDGGNAERAVTMTGGGLLTGFTVRGGVSEDCGGILADGGATVRDVVVENCRATGAEGVGGGLCLYGGSVAENVTASGNTAAVGAGVYATATSAIERCTLEDNVASARGGGAYLEDGSRLSWSVLHGNSAALGGGACGEDCKIADSEMTANTATESGGAAAVAGSTFRNNRLVGNRASASGGGLFAQDTDGHDCLVVSNAAPQGAGVWMEGDGQLWNFTVADNAGPGAGVAARGRTLLGNTIAWGNAGGNLDAEAGTEVRHSCVQPAPAGEGNFADAPAFVGDGDYHIRAVSPCVDAGENQPWMPEASDLDGQRRVETGTEGDGRDIWVDVGADEAAQDAILPPAPGAPLWTWRVVMDARLQLQYAATLMDGAAWQDSGEPFTATGQTWTLDEPFEGSGKRFYRLIWIRE
ncbi:MAG: right-handed parallel beta-helix repeat-containing protein [Kiritimatiellae bacterium]|nr:right-handed parallel beta-helix repeat-containing protein [Kiritimatiellia bacterium]